MTFLLPITQALLPLLASAAALLPPTMFLIVHTEDLESLGGVHMRFTQNRPVEVNGPKLVMFMNFS